MTFDYETWIKQARNRLELLYQQREAITNEISCLERGLQGFEPLAKAAWIGPAAGVTESIRQILSEAPRRIFSPTQIRDELLEKGVRMRQKKPAGDHPPGACSVSGKGNGYSNHPQRSQLLPLDW